MGEIVFVVLLAGGFLIPPAIFKQWRLFTVFAVFFAIFGLLEWLSIAQTGQTISQHFWALDAINPTAGWIIVGGMGIGWAALLWHFKGKRKK
jgi:hypothetical protein